MIADNPSQVRNIRDHRSKNWFGGMSPRMESIAEIPDNRPLSDSEASLVGWLLNHGIANARDYLPQLDRSRVVSRCYCGCASINFAVDGVLPLPGVGISILADFEWKGPRGELFGVFLFERGGVLAALDVWSQDGLADVKSLPSTELLHPIGTSDLPYENSDEVRCL